MTRFQFFESGLGMTAVRLGIVSLEWLVKYDVYKTYLEILASGVDKSEAKIMTSDKCKCHVSSVRRYIDRFESEEDIGDPVKSGNRVTGVNSYWKKWPSQSNPCTNT